MKSTFLKQVLFSLALVGCSSFSQAGLDVYVVAAAKPGGDGSKAAAFQTLSQARDGIRAARKSGAAKTSDPVTVFIGPGEYRLQKTFELIASDGGEEKAPVVYRAVKPGSVRIRGGLTLKASAFTKLSDEGVLARLDLAVRDKIRVYDLAAAVPEAFREFGKSFRGAPVGPWFYVDGKPMPLARWPNLDSPNEGWAGFSKVIDSGLPKADSADPVLKKLHPGSFVFDDVRPARWNLDEGVWLRGYWTHDWSDEVIRIASYDKVKKSITLAAPHNYGIKAGTWGKTERRFFAMNTLEELDAPGEWYLDRPAKRLYFYPKSSLEKTVMVLATMTDPLMRVKNAKHLKFINLAFEYSHGSGILLESTKHVEVAGCELANLSENGISVKGQENTVRSCDVFNIGKSGIILNGGDRKALIAGKNLVENNEVHHFGGFQRTYAPGIRVSGCGHIVRNNSIHDAPHTAILYGGNDHLFELNEVYRVVMETGDAGAFYTGRDWTSQGNILRHNYIHDLGGGDAEHANTMGVYLDDCDGGDTVEGNIFYRAGRAIMIGGGRDNPIINNLVVDCPIGLHMDSRGMTWKHWNNESYPGWALDKKAQAMNYKNPPWSERYPKLAGIMEDSPREPLHNPIRQNVFVDCRQKILSFDTKVMKLMRKLEINDNLAVNTRGLTKGIAAATKVKGFKNLVGTATAPIDLGFSAQGFELKKGARLLKELPSFKTIPFDKIGLMKDEYRSDPVRPVNQKVLLDIDFSNPDELKGWRLPKGLWSIESESLKGVELIEDKHSAGAAYALHYRDAVLSFRFRLSGAKNGQFLMRNRFGNLCRLVFTGDYVRFQKDRPNLPKDNKEKAVFLAKKAIALSDGKWHQARIVIRGESFSVEIDQKEILKGSHPGINVTKTEVEFFASGDAMFYDDLKVESLLK